MRLPFSYVFQHILEPNYNLTSLYGYLALSSFLSTIFLFFLVLTCSTHISFVILFVNSLMKRGSQSSEAIPKSLQHRIKALDLQPSVAVGIPSGSKYCCSPRAMETSRPWTMSPYSLVTSFPVTILSPLGAKPQPPGPNALFNIRLYLISGKYMIPSGFTSTSSCVMGASSVSDCSGVKDMLPRPWYERVQSMAGTPSSSGGASDSPSVSERCFWAADAAVSAVLLRVVGTGGSFAGNEGDTCY